MHRIGKLTVIGGGSTYTPELLSGFIEQRDEISVDTVVLFDIDEQRLQVVGSLAQRMFSRAGVQARIEMTHNRAAALEGAEFIVSQMRIGWMPARILDERIPLQHGVLGQETVGAGGIFNALRTIPVTLEIAEQVSRLAPQAWFLNFTNPSGIITEALIRHGGLERVVGLCNVPINAHQAVADLLDLPVQQVWLDWMGLNHLGWIRRVVVEGTDRLPEVLDRLGEAPPPEVFERFPFPAALLQTLGLLPTYYLRYYYETPRVLDEVRQAGKTRGELVAEIERSLLEQYCDPNLVIKPEELRQRGGARYSEAALRLMKALLSDDREVQVLIVRNQGAIPGLPEEAAVEVPALVGGGGITPLVCEDPPVQVKGLLESVKASDILTIEAARSGSRQKAVQALWANPLVHSFEMAETLTGALLKAHQPYLPQFTQSREA